MLTSYFGFWSTTLPGFMKKTSTYHSGYASGFFIRLPRLGSKTLQSVNILMASLVKRGYQIVGETRWEGKTYESWIFEKQIRKEEPT